MNTLQINPFVRYAGVHSFYVTPRQNSICYDCRLFYIEQGKGSLSANGQSFEISGNEVVYLPPKTSYSFSFVNTANLKIYILNLDLIDKFSNYGKSLGTTTEETFDPLRVIEYDIPDELKTPIVQKTPLSTHKYITNCIDLVLQKTPYYKEETSAWAKLALLEILREHNNDDYPLVQSILEYIKENYANATLNNQTIAERFHYHPNYLNRIIKASTKKTLHEYLLDYRIEMAKRYLISTKLNVTIIAEKTGFTSYTYFIRYFRLKTGESPLQYRRSHERIGV